LVVLWGAAGVIVCEGFEADVQEYLSRIRSLQWQAMQVREEQHIQLTKPLEPYQGASHHHQQQRNRKDGEGDHSSHGPVPGVCKRGFEGGFVELPETGMSELGQMCRAAGIEDLFLSALKISR
jgi:hypothetical protein